MAHYVGNNPVNYVDPTGHYVVTAGLSGIAAFIFGVKGEIGVAQDGHGDLGTYASGQVVSPGIGFGSGVSFGVNWEAKTVDELNGAGGSIGGSLGILGVEIEYDEQGKWSGLEISLGGKGWIASLYAAGGYTYADNLSEDLRKLVRSWEEFKKHDEEILQHCADHPDTGDPQCQSSRP